MRFKNQEGPDRPDSPRQPCPPTVNPATTERGSAARQEGKAQGWNGMQKKEKKIKTILRLTNKRRY